MIARAIHRLRHRESGVTIPEVVIAISVMTVVAGAFLGIVVSLQTNLVRQQSRSNNNDQARLAIEQLDREIRSGNVLYDPSGEVLPYYSLRVYTQANAPTRTPAFQCVQWVLDDGRLMRRAWPPGKPDQAGDWRIVAEDIVNVDLGERAFVLDPETSKGGRTVKVKLAVNGNLAGEPRATIRVQTSLTGRNTSLGFSSDECADLPSDPLPTS